MLFEMVAIMDALLCDRKTKNPPPFCAESRAQKNSALASKAYVIMIYCLVMAKGYGTTNSDYRRWHCMIFQQYLSALG